MAHFIYLSDDELESITANGTNEGFAMLKVYFRSINHRNYDVLAYCGLIRMCIT